MRIEFVTVLIAAIAMTNTGLLAQTLPPVVGVAPPEEEVDVAALCGPSLYDPAVDQIACIKVLVTVDGHGTNCEAAISSGDPAIDQRTCLWVEEHATFSPALDAMGQPEQQPYHMWIKLGEDGKPHAGDPWPDIAYSYPARSLRQEEEGSVGIRVWVGTDGRVQSCKVLVSSGSTHLDQASCDQTTRYGQFDVAYDETGAPIEATYRKMLRWSLSYDVIGEPEAEGENEGEPEVQSRL